jgi:hypothetical protein
MPGERRGQVTRVLTNYGPLETGGTEWLARKVQLSGTSRVTGHSQARFCEGLGVKFPGPTRPGVLLFDRMFFIEVFFIPCSRFSNTAS